MDKLRWNRFEVDTFINVASLGSLLESSKTFEE